MIANENIHRWQLFRSTYNPSWPDLPEPLRQLFGSVRALQERHDVREGQRFLIGPDGRPDVVINRFLASPEMCVRSDHTQRKYAYIITAWLNFLLTLDPPHEWHKATRDDVDAFKFWRMTDERNTRRVTGGTWHSDLNALNTLYTWVCDRYQVTSPIVYRMVRGWYSRHDSTRYHRTTYSTSAEEMTERAAEPAGIRNRDVKWFTPTAYERWVDLGLRGLGPDGRDAVVWRGRNAERDSAFADLLYHTGLRLQEAGSLLLDELPPIDQQRPYYTCRLADTCAKGGSGRKYYMPPVVRETLDQYESIEGERSRAVARAQQAQRYAHLPHLRLVEQVHNRTLRLREPDGTRHRVSLDVLSPRERRNLDRETERGLEPLALWLNYV